MVGFVIGLAASKAMFTDLLLCCGHAGYLVVVGFGALFSAITVGMVWLDYMFGGAHKTSEQVRQSA